MHTWNSRSQTNKYLLAFQLRIISSSALNSVTHSLETFARSFLIHFLFFPSFAYLICLSRMMPDIVELRSNNMKTHTKSSKQMNAISKKIKSHLPVKANPPPTFALEIIFFLLLHLRCFIKCACLIGRCLRAFRNFSNASSTFGIYVLRIGMTPDSFVHRLTCPSIMG